MYSFHETKQNDVDILEIWQTIERNKGYIVFFNGYNTEEVASNILEHAVRNLDTTAGEDFTPYIKNLAKNIAKRTSKEFAYEHVSEQGEISDVFNGLQAEIDYRKFENNRELMLQLRALYLRYEESFNTLGKIFDDKLDSLIPTYDDKREDQHFHKDIAKVGLREKNVDMYTDLRLIVDTFGPQATFSALNILLKEVANLSVPFYTTVKEIQLKPLAKLKKTVEKLGTPTIRTKEGFEFAIDCLTLTMDENPDYFAWDVIGSAKSVIKIDIAPYMEYLYDQLYVEQGVNTRLMQWCGDVYRATTPAGNRLVGERLEHVIENARAELILSIVAANIGKVVAVSPDSVYLKATKDIFNKLKISTAVGKAIVLPVDKK